MQELNWIGLRLMLLNTTEGDVEQVYDGKAGNRFGLKDRTPPP